VTINSKVVFMQRDMLSAKVALKVK